MKIKICGITDPDMAFFAAEAGADFIGIICYPPSKRYVAPDLAKEIAAAAIKGGAEPVAVFVDGEREEIEELGIPTLQLYGKIPVLRDTYRYLYANHPDISLREGDYVLIDYSRGFDGDIPQDKPYFLAGGLTAENVSSAIKKLKPYGVDVCSGVEVNGVKDRKKITTFIEQVRAL